MIPNDPVGVGNAADPYAAYLVYDTFTDTNATALADHTPDKDTEAGGWAVRAGTWEVNNNRGNVSAVAGTATAVINCGVANVVVTTTAKAPNGAGVDVSGIVVREADINNMILSRLRPKIDTVDVYSVIAGGWASLGSVAFDSTRGTDYELEFSYGAGGAWSYSVDEIEKLSGTNNILGTNTNIGLLQHNGTNDDDCFDDFRAVAL